MFSGAYTKEMSLKFTVVHCKYPIAVIFPIDIHLCVIDPGTLGSQSVHDLAVSIVDRYLQIDLPKPQAATQQPTGQQVTGQQDTER